MAFELLDPHGHGFIDASALRDVLSACVFGDSFTEVAAPVDAKAAALLM